MTAVVVMGVAGSGKTTVARALAERLGWVFVDADDLHPARNLAKLRAGQPLTDEDRWPWLQELARRIRQQQRAGTSCVVACSALRRRYRDLLRRDAGPLWFAALQADRETLRQRLTERRGHVMPVSLLDSQLATLEPLAPDEDGVVLDAREAPATLVDAAVSELGEAAARGA